MKPLLKKLLFVSFILVICFSCSDDETDPYSQIEKDIFSLVNQQRAKVGKSALTLNSVVYREAKGHSNNMAAGTVAYGHDGASDRFSRIQKDFGAVLFAENVAMGKNLTAQQVLDAWLASPAHKQNLEGDYNYSAVGVTVSSDGTSYVTDIFIKK